MAGDLDDVTLGYGQAKGNLDDGSKKLGDFLKQGIDPTKGTSDRAKQWGRIQADKDAIDLARAKKDGLVPAPGA